MQNISFGRGSAPPQQPNPSAPAAADTNVNPEPPRASASAPAGAAASESGPPLLESEEHWPALDITNYYRPKKRGGRGRGRGRGGASAGEPNSGEGAPGSSSFSADPTGGKSNQHEGPTSTAPESQPPTDAGAGRAEVATPETAATETAAVGPDDAPLDIDKLMNQAFSWPPSEEQNAQIDDVLYGRRKGHKRLPVFKDICPD